MSTSEQKSQNNQNSATKKATSQKLLPHSPNKKILQMQKKLDNFIQASLDKYHFVEVTSEMQSVAGIYSKHVISNKPAIPDLVIYNKKFNKNDCFLDQNAEDNTPFPR